MNACVVMHDISTNCLFVCLFVCVCVFRFRHQVNQLYDATTVSREWSGAVTSTAFSVRVRRDHLMQDALELLQQVSEKKKALR